MRNWTATGLVGGGHSASIWRTGGPVGEFHETRAGRGDGFLDERPDLGGKRHQFEQGSICRCDIGSMPG
jgi:hypothetical protein